MLAIDSVVMMHHGCNKAADSLTVIVWLMNHMPDGVDNVAGYGDIAFADLDLEVANLSVEGRWHLWHWEIVEETDAVYFQVVGVSKWMDDGAWTYKEQHASLQFLLHQIDSDTGTTLRNQTHAEIVDGKGRLVLLDNHQKHVGAAIEHAQLIVDKGMFNNLTKVGIIHPLHTRVVHQFWLLIHTLFVASFAAKIIKILDIMFYLCKKRTKRTFLHLNG